jgi:chromosome segregation ATPase
MGRVAEYSVEQIIEAGKSIDLAQKRVTPFSIREKLGGGSPERIKEIWEKHLNQIRDEAVIDSSDAELELPAEIQASLEKNLNTASKQLLTLTNDTFRVAMQVSEKRVKSTIDDFNNKIEELEEIERDAFRALEKGDAKIETLESELADLAKVNERLLADNSKLLGQIEVIKERVLQLESIERKYSELQRELGKLEGQLAVCNSDNSRQE